MDAITALHTRVSSPRLVEPAPKPEHREAIFKAALRAPDHAALRTWRFLCVEGEGRVELGEKMVAAALRQDPALSEAMQTRRLNAPQRAPLVIVVVVRLREHPKVPAIEQWLSVGAATSNMLLAAHALGYGAMWRSGSLSHDRSFMTDIGLQAEEHIVGFLYMGSVAGALRSPAEHVVSDYFSPWPAAT